MTMKKNVKLKKLELLGFKSFADKTTLEFSDGVTGVVGPNGCGKSNIADAFRWVLGEQSAKSMRGNKMHDVIFAGTSTRPPLNIAEVTITLTNEDGSLPIPYKEIAITRRLHRNGDSDYLLNRQSVRLKDIQSLFLDSGMGKDAFAIVEQNKIDEVIRSTPLERRYIFEEAAGILRFLQRKRETLRKLEQVDLNTSRAKDIHQEVEKQIVVLEQQAAKARVFKQQRAQLDLLERTLLIGQWDTLQQKHSDAHIREAAQQQNLLDATQYFEQLQSQLKEARDLLIKTENSLRAANEKLFQARSDKEIKTREGHSKQERLKESSAKEKKWQQEVEMLIEKRRQRQAEHSTAQQKHVELEQLLTEATTVLQSQRERTRSLEETVTALREQQQGSQQERLKLLKAETNVESELKQNKVRQDALHEKREAFQQRKGKLTKIISEFSEHAEEKKKEMQAAVKAVDDQKALFQTLLQKLQELSQETQTGKRSFDSLQQSIAECEARQKVLNRLRDDHEGFSVGGKRLLQEAANPKSSLHGMVRGLYEFLNPSSGSETALAGTLRPYSQTLVVETQSQMLQVIEFAKKNQLKDFSLLCLEAIPDAKPSAKSKKSNNEKSLQSKVNDHPLAQHFLHNAFVVDSLEEALEVSKNNVNALIWMSDGLLLDERQVLFYGTQGIQNVFLREAELKTLAKQLITLHNERSKLKEQLDQLQQKRDKLEAEKSALDKCIRRDEMKLVEVNFGYQRLNSDLEKAIAEDKQLNIDAQNLETTLEKIKATLSDLNHQYVAAKAKGTQIQQKCDEFHSELEKQTSTLKIDREGLQEKEGAFRKLSDEHRKMQHSIHILEVQDRESQQQEKRLNEEISLGKELQTHLESQHAELKKGVKDLDLTLSEASNACQILEKEVAANRNGIEQQQEKIQTAKSRIVKTEEELRRIDQQKNQFSAAIQGIVSESQERYNMSVDDVRKAIGTIPEKPSGSCEQLERRIRTLRQEMEQAGDINMTSIEECDKHRERHVFLSQQINDLDGSKEELEAIISQLDTESRKIFIETFEAIRTNFKKHFRTLFNGGEADLMFSESKDILEAGIEIVARPPGKQMSSISLLSGGEKCLTAMALLFGIFEVKPSPFCILDEIDAPLDDSNVQRFVQMVKQFIDRCQFIMITHNKHTMGIADVLCGVSMQEKGVSKLLTMEFAKSEHEQPVLSTV